MVNSEIGLLAVFILIMTGVHCGLHAQVTSLIEKSPFIPADFNPNPINKPSLDDSDKANSALRDLEFRGFYSLDEKFYFNLFNIKEQRGRWVALNESGADYIVTGFNDESEDITIALNGENHEMSLKKPSDRPIPVSTRSAVSGNTSLGTVATSTKPNATGNRQPVVRRRVVLPSRNRNSTQTSRPARPVNKPQGTQIDQRRNADDLIKRLREGR